MIKKLIFIIIFLSFIYSFSLDKIDGIYAVIGNEIVLDSERPLYLYNKNDLKFKRLSYQLFNDLLKNKLILYYAKQDKILKNYYNKNFLKQFLTIQNQKKFTPDILEFYEKQIKSDYIVNAFYDKQINNINVTPKEVKYVSQHIEKLLNFFPKKICISYIDFNIKNIIIHNMLTILKNIKKNIIKKHKFHNYSCVHSILININKKHNLPKKFINALNHLDKHKISNIFQCNSNFYFLKLEKKHIKVFYVLINNYLIDKIKYLSNFDKINKIKRNTNLKKFIYNLHIETNIWVDESDLLQNIKNQLLKLHNGEISQLDNYTINGKKRFFFVKKIDIFPAVSYSFDKDYEQLKALTIFFKQKIKIYNWILNYYKKTYIKMMNK
ncbi:hypothetical protein [Blattabacterium cuenoti]|uniref:hypothetical protein n=1 Tax=Blattabacterium cuenoti TaxID=1653831 RepID=UPI00163BFAC8|nr:hypothetical protein [Blattabacterium cuenoti]